jgi:hypothetical protein
MKDLDPYYGLHECAILESNRSEPLFVTRYVINLTKGHDIETIGKLVKLVQLKLSLTQESVMEDLLKLQERGSARYENSSRRGCYFSRYKSPHNSLTSQRLNCLFFDHKDYSEVFDDELSSHEA